MVYTTLYISLHSNEFSSVIQKQLWNETALFWLHVRLHRQFWTKYLSVLIIFFPNSMKMMPGKGGDNTFMENVEFNYFGRKSPNKRAVRLYIIFKNRRWPLLFGCIQNKYKEAIPGHLKNITKCQLYVRVSVFINKIFVLFLFLIKFLRKQALKLVMNYECSYYKRMCLGHFLHFSCCYSRNNLPLGCYQHLR